MINFNDWLDNGMKNSYILHSTSFYVKSHVLSLFFPQREKTKMKRNLSKPRCLQFQLKSHTSKFKVRTQVCRKKN